jgi:hypothetical protein
LANVSGEAIGYASGSIKALPVVVQRPRYHQG